MAIVVFYEKPGCGTNARQRRMLEAAGHRIIARNLLAEQWTGERLRGFLGDMPVALWFNPAAPRVKSGEIDPEGMDAAAALALLTAEPLLIRRPLIEGDGQRCAGFDSALVASLLGSGEAGTHAQECARPEVEGSCPAPDVARRRPPL